MKSAVLLFTVGAAGLAAAAIGQTAAPDLLPAGPEHDLTVRVCSGCHAPNVIAQQRMTPEGWKEIVNTMADRGAQASDEELEKITAYLSRSFPETPKK